MKADRFYTPPHLAEYLVQNVTITPKVIADFAAGDGALLRAAAATWKGALLIATDVNRGPLDTFVPSECHILRGRCDFVKMHSRIRCSALVGRKASVDLILLNPPFSCRGGAKTSVVMDGMKHTGSLALSFAATALDYLKSGGQMLAILPASCIDAQKDKLLWKAIRNGATLEVISWQGAGTFDGCSARTCVVRITKRHFRLAHAVSSSPVMNDRRPHPTGGIALEIFRGSRAVHKMQGEVGEQGIVFIHTTSMVNGMISREVSRVSISHKDLSGPAVLLPRVGKPDVGKICILSQGIPASLSDCVIALVCKNDHDATELAHILKSGWPSFVPLCRGTGAPYLTIEALLKWLGRRGIQVSAHKSASLALSKIVKHLRTTTELSPEAPFRAAKRGLSGERDAGRMSLAV